MKLTTLLRNRTVQAFSAFVLFVSSACVYAQANSIQSINVSPQAGGRVLVQINMQEPPANPPAGFTVNNPPRIALDFPNTSNAM